jgi:carbon storage regulator
MLVLSRQRDETIMIGDDIEITIVDVRGEKVRLGISAPHRIAVHRKEVYNAITTENAQASLLAGSELEGLSETIRPGPARQRLAKKASGLASPPSPPQRGAGDHPTVSVLPVRKTA